MNHMKKWKKALALTGGMAVLTAVLAGCQMKKYEEIPLPETTVKSSYEAEGDTMEEETEKKGSSVERESFANPANQSHEVESSPVKAEITKETAPAMETRDETVYVNATNVNLRVSPSSTASSVG